MNSIDFIGDIHGHYEELRALLKKLGYFESKGAFRYPQNLRKVVFLGDYIDRGDQSKETIELIRAMRDADSAIPLMGNHEFNALCFWQLNGKNGSPLLKSKGEYLREHSFNKIAIHAKTIDSYRGCQKDFFEMLDFFKTLPFYLEKPGFRAQHACFDAESVKVLQKNKISCFSDGNVDELIVRACDEKNEYPDSLFKPLDILLKGREMELPCGMTFRDGEGVERKRIRLRWWINPQKATLKEISFQSNVDFPSLDLPEEIKALDYYKENEKPVFFGHYWLHGIPKLISPNVCCLDYSVASFKKNGHLAAYRFDGEPVLDNKKFVWVEALKF